MTVEREEIQTRKLFGRVDSVERVAHSIQSERPQEAAELLEASRQALEDAPAVRVQVAAKLLLVSDTTVRAWARSGLLTPRPGTSVGAVDPVRLHRVLRLLDDLRKHGQSRGFRETLWSRLHDDALLSRPDLAESLEQMRAGELIPARTLEEKLADAARR
jgi:hypothetical protein